MEGKLSGEVVHATAVHETQRVPHCFTAQHTLACDWTDTTVCQCGSHDASWLTVYLDGAQLERMNRYRNQYQKELLHFWPRGGHFFDLDFLALLGLSDLFHSKHWLLCLEGYYHYIISIVLKDLEVEVQSRTHVGIVRKALEWIQITVSTYWVFMSFEYTEPENTPFFLWDSNQSHNSCHRFPSLTENYRI